MRAGRPWNGTLRARRAAASARAPHRRGTARSSASSVAADVRRIARQRHPAERPLAPQNSGRMYAGHEAGIGEGVARHAALRPPRRAGCCRSRRPPPRASLQREHGAARDRPSRRGPVARTRRRRAARSSVACVEREPGGHVAGQRVVGRGLVGDHVGQSRRGARARAWTSAALPTSADRERRAAPPPPRRPRPSASSRSAVMRSQ